MSWIGVGQELNRSWIGVGQEFTLSSSYKIKITTHYKISYSGFNFNRKSTFFFRLSVTYEILSFLASIEAEQIIKVNVELAPSICPTQRISIQSYKKCPELLVENNRPNITIKVIDSQSKVAIKNFSISYDCPGSPCLKGKFFYELQTMQFSSQLICFQVFG